jgi:hypothetical protein
LDGQIAVSCAVPSTSFITKPGTPSTSRPLRHARNSTACSPNSFSVLPSFRPVTKVHLPFVLPISPETLQAISPICAILIISREKERPDSGVESGRIVYGEWKVPSPSTTRICGPVALKNCKTTRFCGSVETEKFRKPTRFCGSVGHTVSQSDPQFRNKDRIKIYTNTVLWVTKPHKTNHFKIRAAQ